jgi:hypothetical protein
MPLSLVVIVKAPVLVCVPVSPDTVMVVPAGMSYDTDFRVTVKVLVAPDTGVL